MAFKKEVFGIYGYFDEKLGRKNGMLVSGEETDLIMRIPNNKVYIEPNAEIMTNVDAKKLSPTYFIKRFFLQC